MCARVAGPELLLLDGDHGVRRDLGEVRLDLRPLVPDHRDDADRLDGPRGGQDVPDHGAARDRVQHLHGLGLHPGAPAGGEDDHGDARGAHAPRVGVEPTSLVLIQSQAGPAGRPTGE